jgi:signal transduction histidine kinase
VGTFADEFAQNYDVDVRFVVGEEAPRVLVGAGIEAELLRIAHEALSNALRHGAASTIRLMLGVVGAGVQLRIVDDGRGFDPATLAIRGRTECSAGMIGGGLGLRSMRERVERHGGALVLEGAPGQGVSVQVWLPFDPWAGPTPPTPR